MPDEVRLDGQRPGPSPRRRRTRSRSRMQRPAVLARCGAANDGLPARSIRQLEPSMKLSPLRGRRTGPKRLPTQQAAPAPDYGHHCCIPVGDRSWRRSSCSSWV